MSDYATYAHVHARLPERPTPSASTQPTQAQIEGWVDGADSELTGELRAAGIAVPIETDAGVLLMREWICDYAEGRWLRALANAAADGSNDAGQEMLERFAARILDIRDNPAVYESMLTGGSSSTSDAAEFRSYQLHADKIGDDDSISGGDFAPLVERDVSWQ